MPLAHTDTELIQAKESPYPVAYILDQSHLKAEAKDIGYNDPRDLIDEVHMRFDLADIVILIQDGKTRIIKDSPSVKVFQF